MDVSKRSRTFPTLRSYGTGCVFPVFPLLVLFPFSGVCELCSRQEALSKLAVTEKVELGVIEYGYQAALPTGRQLTGLSVYSIKVMYNLE